MPPARPTSIQGRRIPSREVVRSLSLPASGLLTMDSSDPTPVTRARLLRGVVDADQVVDLQRERHEQRRDEDERSAGVRQRVQRDEAPPDSFACGVGSLRRRDRSRGSHTRSCRCPGLRLPAGGTSIPQARRRCHCCCRFREPRVQWGHDGHRRGARHGRPAAADQAARAAAARPGRRPAPARRAAGPGTGGPAHPGLRPGRLRQDHPARSWLADRGDGRPTAWVSLDERDQRRLDVLDLRPAGRRPRRPGHGLGGARPCCSPGRPRSTAC